MALAAHSSEISSLFEVMARDETPHGDDMPGVEDIVAAIISKQHTLSAEQLTAFETLLDAPDADPQEREELLQAIWNVVVCFIDFQWEKARKRDHSEEDACGSIDLIGTSTARLESDLVESSEAKLEGRVRKAVEKTPCRKGCHDDD